MVNTKKVANINVLFLLSLVIIVQYIHTILLDLYLVHEIIEVILFKTMKTTKNNMALIRFQQSA